MTIYLAKGPCPEPTQTRANTKPSVQLPAHRVTQHAITLWQLQAGIVDPAAARIDLEQFARRCLEVTQLPRALKVDFPHLPDPNRCTYLASPERDDVVLVAQGSCVVTILRAPLPM